ncbi:MAG: NAD-dependent epimerase/dehydratase family protein [Phycisphaerae bacterium]
MQKILVTGAEGFTGAHLVRKLKTSGYQVVAGVWNRARKLAYEKNSTKALVCDVTDAISVARVVASVKPDAVVHLAGPSQSNAAIDEPLLAYQGIVSAWANLLDAVRRSAPRARCLMVSASDVYGSQFANGTPIAENVSPEPDCTFGSMKWAAEQIAATFHREHHLDVMVARPFQFVGAGQPEDSFWRQACDGFVHGLSTTSGECAWPTAGDGFDILSVADVVSGYQCILENGKPNEAYNVCSGTMKTFGDIWNGWSASAGQSVQMPGCDNNTQPQCPGANLIGSNAKLRACGWTPTASIADAWQALQADVKAAAVSAGKLR